MKHNFGKTIVVALGGSIVFPDRIDFNFLRRFRKFLLPRLKKRKFILVVGGGKLSRIYQEAASKVVRVTDDDKDWLGIHATRSNAHLLRTIFRDVADPVVIDSRHKVRKLRHPITVASGWHPGWSTDYIAIRLAADFGAGEAIISGKPDYVYDKDNVKHKNARPLPELSWREYSALIPKKWKPGFSSPVDPVAARLAAKKKIKAVVINGRNLGNFGKLLRGNGFTGTIIG
ncbi:MAG: UMP kinase [bacterium]|nr:UMP kinase [bacterium]